VKFRVFAVGDLPMTIRRTPFTLEFVEETLMNTDPVYEQRLKAQLRAADARIDELDAAARARHAQAEMDEISGLRVHRDRFRELLDNMGQVAREDREALRAQAHDDWMSLQRSLADAHAKYGAWDDARERRFNAHLDEADAALRRASGHEQEAAADTRAEILSSRDDLKTKVADARRSYQDWRERRADKGAIRNLNDADADLDEAIENYAWAVRGVADRFTAGG
jgi:hypothetical protein